MKLKQVRFLSRMGWNLRSVVILYGLFLNVAHWRQDINVDADFAKMHWIPLLGH